jgi:hypothetical protein
MPNIRVTVNENHIKNEVEYTLKKIDEFVEKPDEFGNMFYSMLLGSLVVYHHLWLIGDKDYETAYNKLLEATKKQEVENSLH